MVETKAKSGKAGETEKGKKIDPKLLAAPAVMKDREAISRHIKASSSCWVTVRHCQLLFQICHMSCRTN